MEDDFPVQATAYKGKATYHSQNSSQYKEFWRLQSCKGRGERKKYYISVLLSLSSLWI